MTIQATVSRPLAALGDAQAALEAAAGGPVAVVEGGRVVAYLVPADEVEGTGHRVATREEVLAHLRESRERVQPVLDYLRDK